MSGIELGFLEECEPWQVESRLFPSKVGGKPAWLDLENLPTPEQLQCKNCQQTMIFLCQIYAPHEENANGNVDCTQNFHRTVFVFVCRNSKCCQRNSNENFKVFRSSLQRANKFYPYEPPEDKPDLDFSLNKWTNLCNLCGCKAEKQCSKCKHVYYCSKEHQILDWKEGHKKECCDSSTERKSKLLFLEWEIITEPEEVQEKVFSEEEELQKFSKLQEEGKTGTMSDVPEAELDEHASSEKDKAFAKFQKKISCHPDQAIRYRRGGEPLWIARGPVPGKIPDCNYCGGQRKFEFQIMPQILSMLKETDLDWGVVVIYTCVNSCVEGDNYKEEFIFKQDVELKNI